MEGGRPAFFDKRWFRGVAAQMVFSNVHPKIIPAIDQSVALRVFERTGVRVLFWWVRVFHFHRPFRVHYSNRRNIYVTNSGLLTIPTFSGTHHLITRLIIASLSLPFLVTRSSARLPTIAVRLPLFVLVWSSQPTIQLTMSYSHIGGCTNKGGPDKNKEWRQCGCCWGSGKVKCEEGICHATGK